MTAHKTAALTLKAMDAVIQRFPDPDEHEMLEALKQARTSVWESRAEIRNLRRWLRTLVGAAEMTIRVLDEGRDKLTVEGIARACNDLEFAKDEALHFGLGEPLKRRERA